MYVVFTYITLHWCCSLLYCLRWWMKASVQLPASLAQFYVTSWWIEFLCWSLCPLFTTTPPSRWLWECQMLKGVVSIRRHNAVCAHRCDAVNHCHCLGEQSGREEGNAVAIPISSQVLSGGRVRGVDSRSYSGAALCAYWTWLFSVVSLMHVWIASIQLSRIITYLENWEKLENCNWSGESQGNHIVAVGRGSAVLSCE